MAYKGCFLGLIYYLEKLRDEYQSHFEIKGWFGKVCLYQQWCIATNQKIRPILDLYLYHVSCSDSDTIQYQGGPAGFSL